MTDSATPKSAVDRLRRQNRSCDQCRASKRRCWVSTSGAENAPAICTNCARLSHECTFKRVQSARQSKKTNAQKTFSSGNTDWFLGRSIESDTIVPGNILELGNDLPEAWPEISLTHEFDVFLGELGLTAPPLETELPQVIQPSNHDFHFEGQDTPDKCLSTPGRILDDISTFSQDALHRPLLLLNSSLTSKIIEESLVQIYNVIVSGNSSRWLTNVVAGQPFDVAPRNDLWFTTTLDPAPLNNLIEGVFDPPSLSGPTSSRSLLRDSSLAPHTETIDAGMTLLGAVRFLDHFGGLYGSQLDRFARKASDAALKDVLKVFAMQWLPARNETSNGTTVASSLGTEARTPSTSSMSSLYHESWLQARATLGKARNVRSFRVFYATLLFEAATAPSESHDWNQQKSSFLDDAFNILRALSPLIRKHIKTLGPCSKYSPALDKSLQFMECFGYLRDTVSSLIGDRYCELPDDFVAETSRSSLSDAECTLAAADVRNLNRQHLSKFLFTLRQLMRVKKTLMDNGLADCGPAEGRHRLLTRALEAMENMDEIMKPLIGNSAERFDILEAEFKVQILTLCALWVLGLSSFAEVFSVQSKVGASLTSTELFRKLYSCQSAAASNLSQLMRRVQAQPSLEMFNLYHGLSADVPLTGYHLTTELMVAALRQAIEQQISLRDHDSTSFEGFGLGLTAEDQWRDSIDCLMKGLLMLDVTVGGSRAVQAASQKIIKSYGDILSDCWSTDFDT